MTEYRLRSELAALETRYTVSYDVDERVVVVEDVALAAGWTPNPVTVRVKLPDRGWAAAPRLVLPYELRYRGRVPRQLFVDGRFLVRGALGDPIVFWPETRGSLVAVLDELDAALARAAAAAAVMEAGHRHERNTTEETDNDTR